jgi:hypothetical protein
MHKVVFANQRRLANDIANAGPFIMEQGAAK